MAEHCEGARLVSGLYTQCFIFPFFSRLHSAVRVSSRVCVLTGEAPCSIFDCLLFETVEGIWGEGALWWRASLVFVSSVVAVRDGVGKVSKKMWRKQIIRGCTVELSKGISLLCSYIYIARLLLCCH